MDLLRDAETTFENVKGEAERRAKDALETLTRDLTRLRDELRAGLAVLSQSAKEIPPAARWGSLVDVFETEPGDIQSVYVAITRDGLNHSQHLQGLAIHTADGTIRHRQVPPGRYAVVVELRRLPEDF